MRRDEPNLFEYLLALIVVVILGAALWGWVGDAFSPSHSISGLIVKTYIVGHQYTTESNASVQQPDGKVIVVSMSSEDYGFIDTGDTCAFEVSNNNYVRSMKCRHEPK